MVFLATFHSIIGVFGIYRIKVRTEVQENPDSQFTAMPESITPVGMELNPQTEPIEEPSPDMETNTIDEQTITKSSKVIDEQINENKKLILKTFSIALDIFC